ncbi:MAG: tetratricopeptide repeat protein [Deltaproteobacteria bacterium]|nr:tetratricopeptide repeat protein [Deltaproteobacteria bacterium]
MGLTEILNGFWPWWEQLSQGVRDSIIAGFIVAPILGVLGIFRKGIVRLFSRPSVPQPPPPLPPIIIKIENPPPSAPPALPAAAPPVDTPVPAPAVPRSRAVAGFVARYDRDGKDVVAWLKEQLTPRSSQLVVLSGAGGVGKTTLAIEAAHELLDTFARRVVWVSADGQSQFSFASLLDATAAQLGQPQHRVLPPEQKEAAVGSLLAAAPALIVLDNFETIAQAEQVRCTEWLLHKTACPTMMTSREPIDGAHNKPVGPLSEPEAQELLKRLIGQARNPQHFDRVDPALLIAASARIPLVLEWVVSRIDLLGDAQEVLRDLKRGEGSAAQRVFDRSFALPQVGDDGRAVLLALSLFVPEATRVALAEVSGFGQNETRLAAALSPLLGLLLMKPVDSGQRFMVEGLTRELAKAHLAHDLRADAFHQRFIAYFLRYAEAHQATTPEDLDALEQEKNNLLAALELTFAQRAWEQVIALADALVTPQNDMFSLRGYWDDFIRCGERGAAAAQALGDEAAVSRFSGHVGFMRLRRGEYDQARAAYQQALETWKKLKDERNVAVNLHQLGMITYLQGDYGEARKQYEESLRIRQQLGDQQGIAASLHQLGNIAYEQGDYGEARKQYEESLGINRQLGNQPDIAATLHQLGMIAEDQGDYGEARRQYDESLKIERQLGDQPGIASSLYQLGRLAEIASDKAEAAKLFRQALEILERLRSPDAEKARRSLARVGQE